VFVFCTFQFINLHFNLVEIKRDKVEFVLFCCVDAAASHLLVAIQNISSRQRRAILAVGLDGFCSLREGEGVF
jgi:hypothetical protein